MAKKKESEEKAARRRRKKALRAEINGIYSERHVADLLAMYKDALIRPCEAHIRDEISTEFESIFPPSLRTQYWLREKGKNVARIMMHYKDQGTSELITGIFGEKPGPHVFGNIACSVLLHNCEEIQKIASRDPDSDEIVKNIIVTHSADLFRKRKGCIPELIGIMSADINEEEVLCTMQKHKDFSKIKKVYQKERESLEAARTGLLARFPKDVISFYPHARQIHRKFYLHIGPTNSGKTHDAVAAMKEAGDGIYLAPLRLLAFEQYEAFNAEGFPCSLLTGEEHAEVPDAKFQSSTVEMLDCNIHYSCVVLDEAQMAADESRGGAWTAAVLGAWADEIHVCAAPYAETILIKLIEECGDTYEIIRHERSVPLIMQEEPFFFPRSIQEGDALIVFSRKNVHAVAAELQRKGIECSVLYGDLPYDVRQAEAQRFRDGDTKVVVATDCIGMGLNLPIHRVVFLEQFKFDGKEKRMLNPKEVQQIAGRAGRMGMYSEGFVNSFGMRGEIRSLLEEDVEEIDTVMIDIPHTAVEVPGLLSIIFEQWSQMGGLPAMLRKADISDKIKLCIELEQASDNKELIYNFITMPFHTDNIQLHYLWKALFIGEEKKQPMPIEEIAGYASVSDNAKIQFLESAFKYADLAYVYLTRNGRGSEAVEIMEIKKAISKRIISALKKKKLENRTCRSCGRILSWNYPYGYCDKCYDNLYGGWNYYEYY